MAIFTTAAKLALLAAAFAPSAKGFGLPKSPLSASGLVKHDKTQMVRGSPASEVVARKPDTFKRRLEQFCSAEQMGGDIDGEEAGDQSGFFVSLSADGKTLAAGAPFNDGDNGENSGHVRIFRFNGSGWFKLGDDIEGAAGGDGSGWSVSLSANGGTVAIGAPYNDAGNGNNSGHVRVYTYNGAAWSQLGADIGGAAANDRFGWSVSLSDDGRTVAIGAIDNDGKDGTSVDSGHVQVYFYEGTSWTQLGNALNGEAQGDLFGWRISLSADGRTVAAGAIYNDGEGTNKSGHVRVFSYNGADWIQLGEDIDGKAANNEFGSDVSLSADGRTMAISAVPVRDTSGYVQVYRYITGSGWTQLGDDINGETARLSLSADGRTVAISGAFWDSDRSGIVQVFSYSNTRGWVQVVDDIEGETPGVASGWSVSLSADSTAIAIGAIYANDGNGKNETGNVRVYGLEKCLPEECWEQKGASFDVEAPYLQFGDFVSLSPDGTAVAIGTPGHNETTNRDYRGQIRVYRFSAGPGWTQVGDAIDGKIPHFAFGMAVSLSNDGRIVATGAPFNDEDATGGVDRGRVRVHRYDGNQWIQLGSDIYGEAAGDQSGERISLSADGSTLAVGSFRGESGHVRLYNYTGTSWTQLGQDIDGEEQFDRFGSSISLSADGRTVAIGAPDNGSSGVGSGHVRVFAYNGTEWLQLGSEIGGERAGDHSGWSVALSADGLTVAIGSPLGLVVSNTQSGYVRVFAYSGSGWVQLGDNIGGEEAGDYSGYHVSLSADGRTLVIGAVFNDGNGVDSGHVRVYTYTDIGWTQLGSDIDGEAEGDELGFPVSLSADGMTLAVGAYSSTNSGYVYVYSLDFCVPLSPTTAPEPPTAAPSPGVTMEPTIHPSIVSPTLKPASTMEPTILPPTFEPEPTIQPTIVAPTEPPSQKPDPPEKRTRATFATIELKLSPAEELDQEEIEVFERLTKSWFEEFYQERSGRRSLQVTIPVRDMKTSITMTDQLLAASADNVNTILYSQTIDYVALEGALGPQVYILRPFEDTFANRQYRDSLAGSIDALRFIEPPVEIPVIRDDGGDKGTKTGAIVGIAVGAIVFGIVLGLVAMKRRASCQQPPQIEEKDEGDNGTPQPVTQLHSSHDPTDRTEDLHLDAESQTPDARDPQPAATREVRVSYKDQGQPEHNDSQQTLLAEATFIREN